MVPYKTLKAMKRSRTKVGNLQPYQYGWRVRFKMDSETPTAPESVAGELRPESLDQLSPNNEASEHGADGVVKTREVVLHHRYFSSSSQPFTARDDSRGAGSKLLGSR